MKPLEIIKNDARIRIGYRSPGLTGTLNPTQKMELCHELGMSVIEPQINAREFPTLADATAYKAAADDAGITITSAGILLPYSEPETEDDGEGDAELDVAEALGIDYVFTLVKHPPEGIPHQTTWDLVVRRLGNFAEKAQRRGIRVALEPEWFLGSVERVVRMIGAVAHPNFQLINFDATNFFLNGSDPLDTIAAYGDQIVNGHIKDGFYQTNRRTECAIGEGELDWRAIFSAMLETGGDYTMHIEHCGKPEQVRAAAEVLTGFLKSLS